MPLIAIVLDALAAGVLMMARQAGMSMAMPALIGQAVITVILLIITFSYGGKRHAKIQTSVFMRYFSIRYSIIVISLIVNAVGLALYALAVFGNNPLLFQ